MMLIKTIIYLLLAFLKINLFLFFIFFPFKLIAEDIIEEVTIIADKIEKNSKLGASVISLTEDDLLIKIGSNLGDTLANELGVHNASYGPGVGLPVLRGLSGVRIHLSEDGMGAGDVSSISADHATTIEPLLAETIDILKGPSTVIYGNGAIGGTVQVINNRIHEELTFKDLSSSFEVRRELLNDHHRETMVGKIDAEHENWILHAGGFVRSSKDMSIPGVAIQEDAINEIYGISNSDNTFGTVINTDSETDNLSIGVSYVDESFFFGISRTVINNEYGLPPGAHNEPSDSPGHSHSHPVGGSIVKQAIVRIDLEQERDMIKFGFDVDHLKFKNFSLMLGSIVYDHLEFEADPQTGVPLRGTFYFNDTKELKAKLSHTLFDSLNENHTGEIGLQWTQRSFSAESMDLIFSSEDFIPATDQRGIGLYSYDKFQFEKFSFEIGARREIQKLIQKEFTATLLPNNTQFMHAPITYEVYTLSSALEYQLSKNHEFNLSLSSSQRAPEIQELLSLGSHLATRSYDIGLLLYSNNENQTFPKPEKFNSVDINWEWTNKIGDLRTSAFYTKADDFIYQKTEATSALFDVSDNFFRNTCVRLEECIAVYKYSQEDAVFFGYESQLRLNPINLYSGFLEIELFSDFVRGRFPGVGDLPRMPPKRNGISFEWNSGLINAEIRFSKVFAQNKTGENETSTDSYNLLNAHITYLHELKGLNSSEILFFLRMKNLLNEEIRRSTSFLRNFTPEPGREVTLGFRYQF
jgi:iron complex outermembrane receptor protein